VSDLGQADLRKERHAAVKGATLWEIPAEAKDLLPPLYADIGKFRSDTDRLPGYTDVGEPDAWKPVALQGLRDVMAILVSKATAAEIAAVQEWLLFVAQTTADASKEGALGLVGPRVSEKEETALAEIKEALTAAN
jgi:hypothetical protein